MAYKFLTRLDNILADDTEKLLTSVPDGYEALVLAKLARDGHNAGKNAALVFVARDGQRMADVEAALGFFAPWLRTISLPAWDCLPYDRVSPGQDLAAKRIAVLAEITAGIDPVQPTLILTTPNALVQRVPPRGFMRSQVMHAAGGNHINMDELVGWLEANGFQRTPTVRGNRRICCAWRHSGFVCAGRRYTAAARFFR